MLLEKEKDGSHANVKPPRDASKSNIISILASTTKRKRALKFDAKEVNAGLLRNARTHVQDWVPGGKFSKDEYQVRNPLRNDDNPGSFGINVRKGVVADFATGYYNDLIGFYSELRGISLDAACEEWGQKLGLERRSVPGKVKSNSTKKPDAPAIRNLAEYAHAKKLPLDFLTGLGLKDVPGSKIAIPYKDEDGNLFRMRYRCDGKPRFSWGDENPKQAGVILYGVDRLSPEATSPLWLMEGESDAQTLWHVGHAALGAPGGNNFDPDRDDAHLAAYDPIYVVNENDVGAKAFLAALSGSKHASRMRVVSFGQHKDPSALWVASPDVAAFEAALDSAATASVPLIGFSTEPEPSATAPIDDGGRVGGSSQSDQLLRFALESFSRHRDADKTPYLIGDVDGKRVAIPVESAEMRDTLMCLLFDRFEKVPTSDALKQAVEQLSGLARLKGDVIEVNTRRAFVDGKYVLDIGDDTRRAIVIDRTGWSIADQSPAWFVRTPSMRALPEPKRGGDISRLFGLTNFSVEDRASAIAVIFEGWRSNTPDVAAEIGGNQNSGKSATANLIGSLIDPSKMRSRSVPSTYRDLMAAITASPLLRFGNVSHITKEMQDEFCRVLDGDGFATRTLHSTTGETSVSAKRPIVFDGINRTVTRPDLMRRTISFTLPQLAETDGDTDYAKSVDAALPDIFGGLLDLFVKTLAILPTVRISSKLGLSRVDFVALGEAVTVAMGGASGDFIRRHGERADEAAQAAVDSCPAGLALVDLLQTNGGSWHGTVKGLHGALSANVMDRTAWPKSPQSLANAIRRIEPALGKLGIRAEFSTKRQATGYWVRITSGQA